MIGKIRFRDCLGDKPLYKKMLKIAVPISLQSMITVGINLMDTVMLSDLGDELLSENSLAASSQAGQFINLFMIFCMGIGMGASVLTSRFWGKKDIYSLKKTVTIMLRFALCFAAVFTVVTAVAPRGIMYLFAEEGATEIITLGAAYLKWMVPTFFCMGLSVVCTVILRSVGLVQIPLICSVIAFFVNVFSNWVFIFGHLGMPRMEIEGAALGTLIARVFELLFICGYFFFVDKRIGYRIRDLFLRCRDMVREYFRVSVPVLISDGLLAFGNTAVSMVMGQMGGAFLAANAVTTVVQQLSSVLTQGISNASGIITGHTMGEGDYKKAYRQGYTFLFISGIMGTLAGLLILLVKDAIISFYGVTPEAKAIANQLMYAIAVIMVFQTVGNMLTKGVLRAGGDTKFLMLGDILFLWVASVPLGILVGPVWGWSSFWIYFFLKIDQILKTIWCYFRLRSGKWMKKVRSAGESE